MTNTNQAIHLGATQSFHSQPLLAGLVEVPGVAYRASATRTIDECTMKALRGEFDAAEMSLATFVKVRERDDTLVGLPVFARKLVSQYAFCRDGAALSGYESLAGKRIAVPQYWLTAALWHRWYLAMYGVDPASVVWCPLADDRLEAMPYPDGVQIDWSLKGRGPSDVLRSGHADCFIFARRPLDMKGLRYLSPDPAAQALALARRTGVVPVTHVIAVRAALLAERPGLAEALVELYTRALHYAAQEVAHEAAQFLPLGDLEQDRTRAALGNDWNAYGWRASEPALRTFCEAAVSQGMVRKVDLDSAFVQLEPESPRGEPC
ncbi:MAG: hypothetical protein QHC78_12135 [Pigmentiphaga sp.]|uniref:MqnA/MqnD/SBP family protein n=1 Tax=Pigmentiphaga sp. TaxID=1977564 RepID=UPI0029AFC6F8|nr:MqnA/MqnD/SBP family protein [Pigmentiphaga sp.]MDX3906428.1 hypothetical protein [Pigmentiphaga sp.]